MAFRNDLQIAQTTLNGRYQCRCYFSGVVTSAARFPATGNFRIIIDSEISSGYGWFQAQPSPLRQDMRGAAS